MELKKHKTNIIIVGILLFSSIMIHFLQSEPEIIPNNEEVSDDGIDTFIPKNHTLIPIEIKNSESLDSMFGNYGIVNLYIEKNGQQVLLAKNVKLIRAPKNPSHFAVLVKDHQSIFVTAHDGMFFVSISSNKNSGTVFVTEMKRTQNIQVGIEND